MATDIRNEGADINSLTESMGRTSLQNDGEESRVGPDGEAAPRTDEEYAQTPLTLRAIVSSKEAGVIIGKAGKNVADLRDETGVKAGVSKVVQGVHDRVLTVTGNLDGLAKAYAIVAKGLVEGAPQMGMGGVLSSNGTHPVRLLISHNQMGTIIGRQGLKIKHIQDASGVQLQSFANLPAFGYRPRQTLNNRLIRTNSQYAKASQLTQFNTPAALPDSLGTPSTIVSVYFGNLLQ